MCFDIAKATAKILGTIAYPVAHSANSPAVNDAYGVLGRAMLAGCQDGLAENGFHTHTGDIGPERPPCTSGRGSAEAKLTRWHSITDGRTI